MLKKAMERSRLSKEIEPAHRFQARHSEHRRLRQRGETFKYEKLLNLVGGPALIVAGFAFIPTPSPSYIIIVIGLSMPAGDFQPLARFYDLLEVRLNTAWRLPKGLGADGAALRAPPGSVPREWLAEQCRLALSPGYLEAHLSVLRAVVDPAGQREVLLDRLPHLEIPTLVVWGTRDRVFPHSQASEAVARLPEGSLALIPDCGHMPHVECPDRFLAALDGFLRGGAHS